MRKVILGLFCATIFSNCSSNANNREQEEKYVEMAKQYRARNMVDSAIYCYKQALKVTKNPLYYSNIGGLFNIKNMPEDAIVYLDSAINLDPNDGNYYNNRAKSYALLKEPDNAIADLKQALKYSPSLYEAKLGLAELYFDQQIHDSALIYLNEIVSKEPSNTIYRYYRSKSFMSTRNYDSAMSDLNILLQSDSANADYLSVRAFTYAGLKNPDAAIEDFKKVIELSPNEPTAAYRNIAEIYLRAKKDKKRACEYIEHDAKAHHKEVTTEDREKYCK